MKPDYGDDFVGWLSYISHKKETMSYINKIEKELSREKAKSESLQFKNKELRKKLRVKGKNKNGNKQSKKKINKTPR